MASIDINEFFTYLVPFIRKSLLTLYFYIGLIIGLIITTISCLIQIKWLTHDRIIWHLETCVAQFLHVWMTLPGFWEVDYTVDSNYRDLKSLLKDGP